MTTPLLFKHPKTILAIDPGTTKSGIIVWRDKVIEAAEIDNQDLIQRMRVWDFPMVDVVGIEMIASYGMAVGKEVFETCLWIGRFDEASSYPTQLVYRQHVKIHLCGSARAKDANIRQALLDKHGPTGTKKAPGKLYGVSGHIWAALAIADYIDSAP